MNTSRSLDSDMPVRSTVSTIACPLLSSEREWFCPASIAPKLPGLCELVHKWNKKVGLAGSHDVIKAMRKPAPRGELNLRRTEPLSKNIIGFGFLFPGPRDLAEYSIFNENCLSRGLLNRTLAGCIVAASAMGHRR